MRPSKKDRLFPRRAAPALAICGLALLAAPALFAEASGEETAAAPTREGLRVYLDPETGELTSTPSRDQVEALSKKILSEEPALSRLSAGLEPFDLERGGRGVYLAGRFQSALVVRRTEDSSFEPVCTDAAEHASAALAAPAASRGASGGQPAQWVEK